MRKLLLFIVVAVVTLSSAQTAPAASSDIFSAWNRTLNAAADRRLATAVAERAWVKAGTEMPEASGPTAAAPIVAGRLAAAVHRVQQLRPVVEPILREEGVPTELSAIVLVESGGMLSVSSPKGARGAWQFMPDTARRYGLTVTDERDDRTEIVSATRAAARYLRDLHQQFGDWQLALAAYNAGEQRIERAISRARSHSFSRISNGLPIETRNYVPAVFDAMSALGAQPQLISRPSQSASHLVYATTAESAGIDAPMTNK